MKQLSSSAVVIILNKQFDFLAKTKIIAYQDVRHENQNQNIATTLRNLAILLRFWY